MDRGSIGVVLLAAPLVLTVAVCWVAASRIRVEPRRLSNANWLLVGVLLAVQTLVDLGVPGIGSFAVVMIAAPLMVACLAVFLVMGGSGMVRAGDVLVGRSWLVAGIGFLALVGCTVPVLMLDSEWLATGLVVALLATGYLGFQFVAFLGYTLIYPRLPAERRVGWVVVLGFGEGPGITPMVASRIQTGIAEYVRRDARLLLMSSGRTVAGLGIEADLMAEWAIAQGADPVTIDRETGSHTPADALRKSMSLVAARASGDGLVVTSSCHVLRVAMLARRIGMPAQAVGAPTDGQWPRAIIRDFTSVLAEHTATHVVIVLLIVLPLPVLIALNYLGI